ncbi:MAG: excinuclease ABC subunit UvrA, partial [Erysipelotrichaceae bacterium]|nr:excinuclease ABC subunit UvrA [Erysipelotrichaceae bacterium]
KKAKKIVFTNKEGEGLSLPQLMEMDVNHAISFCKDMNTVRPKLQILQDLGLGYLTLGEETPSLSGGEAQRLKLASEMGRQQADSVFVFDEPTIGLHPKDVETLLNVFDALIGQGATVIVIEHDLDVIRSAYYIIDMGPEGGELGGRIVAKGSVEEIKNNKESITGRFI